MIKIVFFDIDGTLVSLKTKVSSPSTRRAVKALREKGTLVYIATGRDRGEIVGENLLEGISYDGMLTNNGQAAFDADGKLVYGITMDKKDVDKLLNWVEKTGCACWITTEKGSVINHYTDRVYPAMESIHTRLPVLGDVRQAAQYDVYKIVLFLNREEMQEPLSFMPNCRCAQWHQYGFDLMSTQGGKGVGVEKVLEKLGLKKEESMAFGDGENDMDMLLAAGVGVAMGNAPDHVKAVSDYVAEDVDEDGIEKTLRRFDLI